MTIEQPGGPARPPRTAVIEGWMHWCVAYWRPILVTTLVIGALGLVGGTYFYRYSPDRRIGDAAAQQAIRAAADGTVAMLSYSPESLDQDFARARLYLTGDLLADYTKSSEQIIGPAAKAKQMAASAKVVRAAVSELHQNLAVVLVFVNQSTITNDEPQATVTDSSALVTLAKINGSWLIAKFDRL
ncbi:hypothetical protein [Mycobacterium riyadhense]|uniref:hypothetical protein n=1 Tax=Mycobacterium riyadhense TaxID=486698 RepID=UPI001EF9E8A2|nr:hypothetical protein [Mycobacterium riyadhense]